MIKDKCKKVIYSTKNFAEQDIKRIKKTSNRKDIPKRAYFCSDCDGWHLTKMIHSIETIATELQNKTNEINALKKIKGIDTSNLKAIIKGQEASIIKHKATILKLKNQIINLKNDRDEWKFQTKRLIHEKQSND